MPKASKWLEAEVRRKHELVERENLHCRATGRKHELYVDGVAVIVDVSTVLGEGHARVGHPCNYVDDSGRTYVAKRAKHRGGRETNLFEISLYRMFENTPYAEYFPRFVFISDCHTWLLVERCQTALDVEREAKSASDYDRVNDVLCDYAERFPHFLKNDLHRNNWGFTLVDRRPVVFDIGYDRSHFVKISQMLGAKEHEQEVFMSTAPTRIANGW
jgi:hypothetical protein